jgi:hypothetical protein
MCKDFFNNNGLIDFVPYLDEVLDIRKVSNNHHSFYDIVKRDFKAKGFIKTIDRKFLCSSANLISFIQNSKLIKDYKSKVDINIIEWFINDILTSELEFVKLLNGCSYGLKHDDKEFFDLLDIENINSLYSMIVDDLQAIKRDSESGFPLSRDINEIVQKWSIILSYQVRFATIRSRFTKAKNSVKSSDLADDIKNMFLSKFFFSHSISSLINNRTDSNSLDKITHKIDIDKVDYENNFKSLITEIDNLDIKLDKHNNVVSAKYVTINRGRTGRLVSISFMDNTKMRIFTKLALFISLATGRRLAELVRKPSNLNQRIDSSKSDIIGFSDTVDLKYKEIFLKVKGDGNRAIFLNQMKKRAGIDVHSFSIPINGGYERIIKSLLLLRLFIPSSIIKKNEDEVSNYMRNYLVKDIFFKYAIHLNDLKDCRGFYAIYNESKYNYNNIDTLVYCQQILGHSNDKQSLQSTLNYSRFRLV